MNGLLNTPAKALTVVLAALCGVLVLVLVGQRLLGGGESDVQVVQPSTGERPTAADLKTGGFSLPSLGCYSAIVERPLFNKSRRPVAEEEKARKQQEQKRQQRRLAANRLPPVRLTGVIITPEVSVAMVRNKRNNEFFALTEGAELQGWRVESIDSRRVVFTSGGGREVVELEVYTGGGVARARARRNPNVTASGRIRSRIKLERKRRRALIKAARENLGDG